MYLRLAALTALAVVANVRPLPPQGVNCVLLGTHNLHPTYANIWGYVAPNGNEYALLGARSGTVIVDCTNPATPIERGFIPGANSQWRELQTYQNYCYVVTEGAGGFQVIDLSNPNAPTLVGVTGAAQFNNCHTITVDRGTGRVYCNGTGAGTVVYDAAANPANPVFVGYATPAGQPNYLHDLHASNGFGYASMIYNGQCRIWDTTTFPPTTLSNITTPGTFTHNAWPNAAHTLLVTTDEVTGGVAKFYDITNKASPIALGQYTTNSASIVHNAYIIGSLCYVSWYTEGYICLDVSDANNPVEIASYDTWPGGSGGFNGAWGVYPFMPSGNVYILDISTGLYVVRNSITDLAVTHTPLANTTNEDGPYVVNATVTGTNPLSSVVLHWRVGSSGAFTSTPMTTAGPPNQWTASIPGQNAYATIEYRIEATDSVGVRTSPQSGNHAFSVGTVTVAYTDLFDGTQTPWTTGVVAGTQNDWQFGSPAGRTGNGWSDPIGPASGAACWGTDLGNTIGGTAFNGAYYANENVYLQSPPIPTNGVQGLRLRFSRWLSIHSADVARVLVNGNQVFANGGVSVVDTSWTTVEYDVSAILDSATTATIRFELTSGATTNYGGWNVDDVQLVAISDCVPANEYGTGTAGSGGITPTLAIGGVQRIGGNFSIEGSQLLGATAAVFVLNFAPANAPILGIVANVDPNGAGTYVTTTSGSGAGNGAASWPLAVPPNPAYDNLYLYAQIVALDSGSANGMLSSSRGLRFRVCAQ